MLIQILSHTPTWVYALLAALLWLGGRQLRAGTAPLWRVVAMPVAMVTLAVYGVITAFGHSPAGLGGLACWALGAVPVALAVLRQPPHPEVRYDAATRRVHQPGSWMPLALILAIFLTKYSVGVMLAMHPDYAQQTGLAVSISSMYGVFSGLFAGRALRLWRLAHRTVRGSANSGGTLVA